MTLIDAVPSADRGRAGPSATALSPKTTTPAAGPPPLGSETLAESVTGEHAAVAPEGGLAERVIEHAWYPICCPSGCMAACEPKAERRPLAANDVAVAILDGDDEEEDAA